MSLVGYDFFNYGNVISLKSENRVFEGGGVDDPQYKAQFMKGAGCNALRPIELYHLGDDEAKKQYGYTYDEFMDGNTGISGNLRYAQSGVKPMKSCNAYYPCATAVCIDDGKYETIPHECVPMRSQSPKCFPKDWRNNQTLVNEYLLAQATTTIQQLFECFPKCCLNLLGNCAMLNSGQTGADALIPKEICRLNDGYFGEGDPMALSQSYCGCYFWVNNGEFGINTMAPRPYPRWPGELNEYSSGPDDNLWRPIENEYDIYGRDINYRYTDDIIRQAILNYNPQAVDLSGWDKEDFIRYVVDSGGTPCNSEKGCGCVEDCPQDCVVSSWGGWSPCTEVDTDGRKSYQKTRSRRVVIPSGQGGAECPVLTETTTCVPPSQHGKILGLFTWEQFWPVAAVAGVVGVGLIGTNIIRGGK